VSGFTQGGPGFPLIGASPLAVLQPALSRLSTREVGFGLRWRLLAAEADTYSSPALSPRVRIVAAPMSPVTFWIVAIPS